MKYHYLILCILISLLTSCATIFEIDTQNTSDHLEDSKMIGNNYIDKQLYNKAEKTFLEIVDNYPSDADSHYKLGFIYYQTGQFDKSSNHYLKVISIDPSFHKAYYNLGVIYSTKGYQSYNVHQASAFFKQYLTIQPDSPYAEKIQHWLINHKQLVSASHLKKTGNNYFRKNDLIKARKLFEQCNPKDKEIHYKLGVIYKRLGLLQQSIEQFSRVIKADKKLTKPYYPMAFYYLSKIYATKGAYYHVEKSEYYLKKYRQYVPHSKPKIARKTKKHTKKPVKQKVAEMKMSEPKPIDKQWIEKQTQLIMNNSHMPHKVIPNNNESELAPNNRQHIMDKNWVQQQIESMDF